MEKKAFMFTGKSSCGKTSTVVNVYKKLLAHYKGRCKENCLNKRLRKEIFAVLEIDGGNHKIGFVSSGDDPNKAKPAVKELIKLGCDLIVCAARIFVRYPADMVISPLTKILENGGFDITQVQLEWSQKNSGIKRNEGDAVVTKITAIIPQIEETILLRG